MSKTLISWIKDNSEKLASLSDEIWSFAELGFQEYKSSKLLSQTLLEAGFSVKTEVADMPTAFYASYGEGDKVLLNKN